MNIIMLLWWSLGRGNRVVPSRWQATSDKSPLEVSSGERHEQYAAWWAQGGIGFLGAFANLRFDREANDTAAEFVRPRPVNGP